MLVFASGVPSDLATPSTSIQYALMHRWWSFVRGGFRHSSEEVNIKGVAKSDTNVEARRHQTDALAAESLFGQHVACRR